MQQMAGDGETVTPSLPEPDVWTGTACADVSGPLRWKRAKTIEARGGDVVQPHQEAGYTSAVVAVDPDQASRCNRAGSIYVHTWPIASFARTSADLESAIEQNS